MAQSETAYSMILGDARECLYKVKGESMEWTITVNEENQYVEVVTSGIADSDGSLNMAKAIPLAISNYKIKKILIDHRNITSASGRVADVYSRQKQFQDMGIVQGIKIAEIIKPEHTDFFKFFELVCKNRGYSFSVFNEKESALSWLLNS